MKATLMCWGFDCGDGWYMLIDTACSLMYAPYESAREDYEFSRSQEGTFSEALGVFVDAVAVERARLSIRDAASAVPLALQIKEKHGSLRFYVHNADVRSLALIEFAEAMSQSVCELCARPGLLRDAGGWLRTRCNAHERDCAD